jgi:hypothetical protein
MTRTFHPHLSKTLLVCCLLPCTVLAVYCFLAKLALLALLFFVMMVFCVERLVHTEFTLSDDGKLTISHGRFSRPKTIDAGGVERIELLHATFPARLWCGDAVLLTYDGGRQLVLAPNTPEEFARALLLAKEKHAAPGEPGTKA